MKEEVSKAGWKCQGLTACKGYSGTTEEDGNSEPGKPAPTKLSGSTASKKKAQTQ